jgi:hypothetical protein
MDYAILVLSYVLMIGGVVMTMAALLPVPGRIARERSHPSADAIAALAWLSLLIWPLWLVAYVWAKSRPAPR